MRGGKVETGFGAGRLWRGLQAPHNVGANFP